MGALALPTSGTVYLDTNAIIYSVERVAPYWPLLRPIWQAAGSGTFLILSSEVTLLETLVKPIRDGNTRLENRYRRLLTTAREMHLVSINRLMLEQAARLRASTGIKTPDAIHAATALHEGCLLFVSNDPVFRRVSRLPVAILDDYTTP